MTTSVTEAGSGFYYGVDRVSRDLETKTDTRLTFTPAPPDPTQLVDEDSESFEDTELYLGYRYKRRRTDSFYWAPEFSLGQLDSDELIYSTGLKLGMTLEQFAPFVSIGVSRIQAFDTNELYFGVGTQLYLTPRIALNIEWQRYDSIDERSSDIRSVGAQTLTTSTDTKRDIEAVRIGLTIYLEE